MESDEEYENLPSEFYYPEERLDENSDEASVEASPARLKARKKLKAF